MRIVVAMSGGVDSSVAAALLAWQVQTLDPDNPDNALIRFKNNHYVGIALTLALLADWVW